jgi:hypothetical protein
LEVPETVNSGGMITGRKPERTGMKVYQDDNFKTVCGSARDWEKMKKEFKGANDVSILDLRTLKEIGGETIKDLPQGWRLSQHPISGQTVSEQDVDVFRREQRRNGKLIAVGLSETRGSLLVLTDKARRTRTSLNQDELDFLSRMSQESALRDWLEAYLERHRTTDTIGEY